MKKNRKRRRKARVSVSHLGSKEGYEDEKEERRKKRGCGGKNSSFFLVKEERMRERGRER